MDPFVGVRQFFEELSVRHGLVGLHAVLSEYAPVEFDGHRDGGSPGRGRHFW